MTSRIAEERACHTRILISCGAIVFLMLKFGNISKYPVINYFLINLKIILISHHLILSNRKMLHMLNIGLLEK